MVVINFLALAFITNGIKRLCLEKEKEIIGYIVRRWDDRDLGRLGNPLMTVAAE